MRWRFLCPQPLLHRGEPLHDLQRRGRQAHRRMHDWGSLHVHPRKVWAPESMLWNRFLQWKRMIHIPSKAAWKASQAWSLKWPSYKLLPSSVSQTRLNQYVSLVNACINLNHSFTIHSTAMLLFLKSPWLSTGPTQKPKSSLAKLCKPAPECWRTWPEWGYGSIMVVTVAHSSLKAAP